MLPEPEGEAGARLRRGTEGERQAAVALLAERVGAAFDSTESRLDRLGVAGTSVAITVDDRPGVTLLLDRNPPVMIQGEEPAEVTIGLSARQAVRFAQGALMLSTEMATGAIPFRGPARKYLTVHPVVRSLLEDLDAGRLTR